MPLIGTGVQATDLRHALNNSNTLFSTELAGVKDYSRRFAKQMDKTTEIGQSYALPLPSTGFDVTDDAGTS